MSRRIADSGPALMSGDHSNVLADIRGRVRLASRNLMPNGDLDDAGEDKDGNASAVDGWILEAQPQVSGWMPYYAEESGKPLHRMLFEALGIGRGYFKVDRTPIKAGQAPDPTDRGRVGRPERFWVDLIPVGDIGLAADTYWVAINYIVGNSRLPRKRLRWTEESDYVRVDVPTDGMGIEVFLPPDRPEGITAVGVLVKRGSLGNPARLQEVMFVRYGIRESIKLRGAWRNGHAPPSINTTYIGALNQIASPQVHLGSRSPDRRKRARGRSGGGSYQFRVLVKTEFGWTLAGKASRWRSNGFGKRSSAFWISPRPIRNGQVEEFAVEVRGRLLDAPDVVSEWKRYGFGSGQMSFPVGTWVPVQGWNEDNIPSAHVLESANTQAEDESGVPKPEVDLEEPLTFAGSPMGPGTKFLKATWAYKEEDDLGRVEERESPPSPLVRVVVPSSGGAATHTIRFQRPPGMNEEHNPRFVDLRRDQQEERWVRNPEGATGAIFGPQLGYTEVTDTTLKDTNQAVYYSAPVDITDGKDRAIRMTVELDEAEYISGRVRVDVEFLDANGVLIPGATRTVGRTAHVGREYMHATIGSRIPASHADIRWPQQATHYRRKFIHLGSTSHGVRNFVATYKDIGAYPGLAHPEKRFDLSEDERLVAADYPPNAYISALSRELVDEERIRPEQNMSGWVQEVIDFDDGGGSEYLTFISDGGSQGLFTERPISGSQSIRLAQGAGTHAYKRLDAGVGRATLDAIARLRMDTLPSTGRTSIFRVAGDTGAIGFFEVAGNGDLYCQSRDAADVVTTTTFADFGIDDVHDMRLEIGVENAGTVNGVVNYYFTWGAGIRRNRIARHTGVDLTGKHPRYIDTGITYSVSGSGAIVEADEIEAYKEDIWEDVPGRLVEYWAANGTPVSPLNGMRGHQVPVDGGKAQILSAFFDARGIPNNAGLLRFVAKNEKGAVVARYGALATVTGRKRMRRYWRRIAWPLTAAYIEFEDNLLGAGLVRYGQIQVEDDTPDGRPTPFTNKHVPDGSVEVEFSNLIPGLPKEHILSFRNKLKEYRGAADRSDTPDATSVDVEFCSSPDVDEANPSYSPWTQDLDAVPITPYGTFKIRANLHTDDLEVTPQLNELVLDFVREKPVVCRSDGTEFTGGAMPVDFPAVQYLPNVRTETYADNSTGFTTFGERQARADGWKIEAYLDEGVEQISEEIGKNDSALVVDVLGKRYHCQAFAAPFGPPNRQREYAVGNREIGGFVFVSDGILSSVLAEEPL